MAEMDALYIQEVDSAIERALAEDVRDGDITTQWTVPPDVVARAELISREPGIIAGLDVAAATFRHVDSRIGFERLAGEGDRVASDTVLAEVSGPARGILTAERTALNFVQRMSGIATATARYVEAVNGTQVRILDTRKTAPGLRALDKRAVVAG